MIFFARKGRAYLEKERWAASARSYRELRKFYQLQQELKILGKGSGGRSATQMKGAKLTHHIIIYIIYLIYLIYVINLTFSFLFYILFFSHLSRIQIFHSFLTDSLSSSSSSPSIKSKIQSTTVRKFDGLDAEDRGRDRDRDRGRGGEGEGKGQGKGKREERKELELEDRRRSLSPYSPGKYDGEDLDVYDSGISGSLEYSQSKSRSRSITPSKKVENEVEEEEYSMNEDYEDDNEIEEEEEDKEEEEEEEEIEEGKSKKVTIGREALTGTVTGTGTRTGTGNNSGVEKKGNKDKEIVSNSNPSSLQSSYEFLSKNQTYPSNNMKGKSSLKNMNNRSLNNSIEIEVEEEEEPTNENENDDEDQYQDSFILEDSVTRDGSLLYGGQKNVLEVQKNFPTKTISFQVDNDRYSKEADGGDEEGTDYEVDYEVEAEINESVNDNDHHSLPDSSRNESIIKNKPHVINSNESRRNVTDNYGEEDEIEEEEGSLERTDEKMLLDKKKNTGEDEDNSDDNYDSSNNYDNDNNSSNDNDDNKDDDDDDDEDQDERYSEQSYSPDFEASRGSLENSKSGPSPYPNPSYNDSSSSLEEGNDGNIKKENKDIKGKGEGSSYKNKRKGGINKNEEGDGEIGRIINDKKKDDIMMHEGQGIEEKKNINKDASLSDGQGQGHGQGQGYGQGQGEGLVHGQIDDIFEASADTLMDLEGSIDRRQTSIGALKGKLAMLQNERNRLNLLQKKR